jgi:hypothetical protein
MKIFIRMNTIVSAFYILLGTLGIVQISKGLALYCSDDGLQWIYITNRGNLFATGHIIVLIIQCIMCVRIFYSIPHHYELLERKHYFCHHHEGEEGERERLTED